MTDATAISPTDRILAAHRRVRDAQQAAADRLEAIAAAPMQTAELARLINVTWRTAKNLQLQAAGEARPPRHV